MSVNKKDEELDKKELIDQLNFLREKNEKLEDFVARAKSESAQPGERPESRVNIVEKLRESQRLIDLSHVIIRDADSRIILWTSGDEKLYGYSKKETLGKVSHDLFKTIFPVSKEAVDEALEKTGHWEGVLVHTAKDGHQVYVASHQVMDREHGKPIRIVEVNNDITEQKRIEERLRTTNEELKVSEEELKSNIEELNSAQEQLREKIDELKATETPLQRLATVVRDSSDAILLVDLEGNIVAWNKGAELMYGYSEDEALKMDLSAIVPANERAGYMDMMDKLRRGEAIRSFQTKRMTKDGRILDVWLTVTVLKDEEGRPYNISKIERDITEIKRTEEQLRASNEELKVSEEELKSNIEELNSSQEQLREKIDELKATEAPLQRLATVVRDSNDAIMLLDFEGNILAWNKGSEEMYGYSEDEALKMNIISIVPDDERAGHRDLTDKLRRGEAVRSFQTRRRTKDGRILDVWITLTALTDEAGKPYMVATTERDITDMKRNAKALQDAVEKLQFETEQLETSNEELEVTNEELLSTNSELDIAIKANEEKKAELDYYSVTFLRMIQDSLDSLNARIRTTAHELKGETLPEKCEVLGGLLDEDRKAVSTMYDFSAFLKAFSAKVQVERVDLSSLVSSILKSLKRDDPQATVYTSVGKMLYAYADRDMIEIALQYLLQDSWRHAREKANGKIFFMLTVSDTKFSFVIIDNRSDYNIAEPEWLSESYEYRAKLPEKKEYFQLAIAKRIIEKNDGKIWVEYKKGFYYLHFSLPILPRV